MHKIKSWHTEERPREKLLAHGAQTLSNAEILGILLGSGSRAETAVDLGRRILRLYENNLHALGRACLLDLRQFKGVGDAKAVTILAALELGRRRLHAPQLQRVQIKDSRTAYELLGPKLRDLAHEEFWVLLLNRANEVVRSERISQGGVAGTVVDIKIIFQRALTYLASGILLFHNHPSGNRQPSQMDIKITRRIRAAGKTMDIDVLDHIIVAENQYFSFVDEGYWD